MQSCQNETSRKGFPFEPSVWPATSFYRDQHGTFSSIPTVNYTVDVLLSFLTGKWNLGSGGRRNLEGSR